MVSKTPKPMMTRRSASDLKNRRPKRNISPKNLDDSVSGLSWKEERELKKALYASLQESRRQSHDGKPEDEDSIADSRDGMSHCPSRTSLCSLGEQKSMDESSCSLDCNRSFIEKKETTRLDAKKTKFHAQRKYAVNSFTPICPEPSCSGARATRNASVSQQKKIHAQRKFAHGSTPTSPVETLSKPKLKASPVKLFPGRPKTEDFLTYLCFRGTSVLPPHLDLMNVKKEETEPETTGTNGRLGLALGTDGRLGFTRDSSPASSSSMSHQNEDSMDVQDVPLRVQTPSRKAARASASTPETARGYAYLRRRERHSAASVSKMSPGSRKRLTDAYGPTGKFKAKNLMKGHMTDRLTLKRKAMATLTAARRASPKKPEGNKNLRTSVSDGELLKRKSILSEDISDMDKCDNVQSLIPLGEKSEPEEAVDNSNNVKTCIHPGEKSEVEETMNDDNNVMTSIHPGENSEHEETLHVGNNVKTSIHLGENSEHEETLHVGNNAKTSIHPGEKSEHEETMNDNNNVKSLIYPGEMSEPKEMTNVGNNVKTLIYPVEKSEPEETMNDGNNVKSLIYPGEMSEPKETTNVGNNVKTLIYPVEKSEPEETTNDGNNVKSLIHPNVQSIIQPVVKSEPEEAINDNHIVFEIVDDENKKMTNCNNQKYTCPKDKGLLEEAESKKALEDSGIHVSFNDNKASDDTEQSRLSKSLNFETDIERPEVKSIEMGNEYEAEYIELMRSEMCDPANISCASLLKPLEPELDESIDIFLDMDISLNDSLDVNEIISFGETWSGVLSPEIKKKNQAEVAKTKWKSETCHFFKPAFDLPPKQLQTMPKEIVVPVRRTSQRRKRTMNESSESTRTLSDHSYSKIKTPVKFLIKSRKSKNIGPLCCSTRAPESCAGQLKSTRITTPARPMKSRIATCAGQMKTPYVATCAEQVKSSHIATRARQVKSPCPVSRMGQVKAHIATCVRQIKSHIATRAGRLKSPHTATCVEQMKSPHIATRAGRLKSHTATCVGQMKSQIATRAGRVKSPHTATRTQPKRKLPLSPVNGKRECGTKTNHSATNSNGTRKRKSTNTSHDSNTPTPPKQNRIRNDKTVKTVLKCRSKESRANSSHKIKYIDKLETHPNKRHATTLRKRKTFKPHKPITRATTHLKQALKAAKTAANKKLKVMSKVLPSGKSFNRLSDSVRNKRKSDVSEKKKLSFESSGSRTSLASLGSDSSGEIRIKTERFPGDTDPSAVVQCPTYYPSEDQFRDPILYIQGIQSEAEQYGMCKIVPPCSWKMESREMEDFRFTTQIQYIHKLMHKWSPITEQLEYIKRLHNDAGSEEFQVPQIGGVELDLVKLYELVQKYGGMKGTVGKEKKWLKIADSMMIPKQADRVSKLYAAYCKYLLAYETLSEEETEKLQHTVQTDRRKQEAEKHIPSSYKCVYKGKSQPLSGFHRAARNTQLLYDAQENNDAERIENDYWDTVGKSDDHVSVQGASLDTSIYGSMFPVRRDNVYARHGWNLHNFVESKGSILHHLGLIAGVTVPTLHIGMLYTSRCLSCNEHNLPTVQYLHQGPGVVWYAVPSQETCNLKSAMKKVAPKLVREDGFCIQRNSAMVPPCKLVDKGVSLSRCVQTEREFVVIFPSVNYSNMSLGYNLSESVHYGTQDWIPEGYHASKNLGVNHDIELFSMDAMLVFLARDATTQDTTLALLLPYLENVVEREILERKKLFEAGLKVMERLHDKLEKPAQKCDVLEEIIICDVSNKICYLSMVLNTHENSAFSLEQGLVHVLKRKNLKHCKLMYRYSEEELKALLKEVKSRLRGGNSSSPGTSSPKRKTRKSVSDINSSPTSSTSSSS